MPALLPCRRTLPHAAAPTCVLMALLLVACTGSDSRDLPEAEEFAAGACREAAPAVLALDRHARAILEDGADAADLRRALREQQDRLRPLSEGEDQVSTALQDLVGSVGFLRVAVDTDALDASEVSEVNDAVDRVIAVCVPAAG